jgi:AraC family transcriptional regulator of arabinose operon
MQQNDFSNIVPELLYFVNRKRMPAWRIERGDIDFHDLTYIYSGRATYFINGIEYKLQQGDFIYIPAGNVREAFTSTDEPMQCYAANFKLHMPGEDNNINLPFDHVFKTGLTSEFINLYSELDHIWVEKAYNYKMRARAVFLMILDKLICRVSSGHLSLQEDPRLNTIKQYILHNYLHKIEISKLAELAGLNAVYLGAYFKQVNGCTIKQYINRIRINNAENLLSAGGYSVSEAAMRSGFDDLFYFSKVYKSYKGYSPSILLKVKAGW